VLDKETLYQAILERHSVRRYDSAPLDASTLTRIEEIVQQVQPLVPANRMDVLRRDHAIDEDLIIILDVYGRFISPPHALAPYIRGQEHLLVDLGYRVEQMAVRMAGLGVGSCYVGALRREQEVRERLGLPVQARIGAYLVFGQPATSLGGRAFNALISSVSGGSKRLPVTRIFFQGSFDHPASPPAGLAPLIEAARYAPSAVNAQPWRFLWRDGPALTCPHDQCQGSQADGRLYLFVKRENRRYGGGANVAYRLYDGGICMANVALAMEALDVPGAWALCEATDPQLPTHPADLAPLAMLTLDEPLA